MDFIKLLYVIEVKYIMKNTFPFFRDAKNYLI